MTFALDPVAYVRGGRRELVDDDWGASIATIELAEWLTDAALTGLGDFSHVEVLLVFDRVNENEVERGARHPRGRSDWPLVGIFAQRGKNRPNRLGSTICEIVDCAGRALTVRGLDAIDGTPIVDLKPVMTGFLPRNAVREPQWATKIMGEYW